MFKKLIVKIFNPNIRNPESEYIQNTSSPLHKNNFLISFNEINAILIIAIVIKIVIK